MLPSFWGMECLNDTPISCLTDVTDLCHEPCSIVRMPVGHTNNNENHNKWYVGTHNRLRPHRNSVFVAYYERQ